MRVAIIDLGTNSVRFDVHSLGEKGGPRLLHREKLMIRLGQGVFLKGRMDPSAMARGLQAFEHFRKLATEFRATKIVAFGTSALREAQDSAHFVDIVRENTGIDVKVISGEEEAKLIAIGVLANEKPPAGPFALVDIGGGSTEISLCAGKKVHKAHSFPLGTARLQQVFLKKNPPRAAAIAQLRGYIQNIVGQKMASEGWKAVNTIMGSSGTVRAVAKLLGSKDKSFSVQDLAELVRELSTMNTSQLLDVPGMEAKRVDMIVAGSVLLEEIARALGAKRIVPTDFSLRDGIVEEERRLAATQKRSLIEFHMDDLISRASRFGADPKHVLHMSEVAGQLFDRLRGLHKLENDWKIYLLASVILRNCGEIIGFAGREKHSYYIVKQSDFPSMQNWEHEFIARLCLYSPGAKLTPKDLAPVGGDKKRKDAFRKILALVRVIDSLDIGPQTTIQFKKVKVDARAVTIAFGGESTAGIEELLTDRKKKLFEQTYGRKLVLQRHAGLLPLRRRG
ncbi:MAG: Ppx/GppA family phosphatase [Proteobacteria bacterium]|nr:MAG: Ppx/GppA family phosphatase [Pseudomonadota bacterium]